MSDSEKPLDRKNFYVPVFYVTRAEYDAASPEERERFNYVVNEDILPEPFWVTPVSEPDDD
ncbi:MAG TPA: hypothetical protein DIW43_10455 [Spongiibacteraceae bacterium]|nr:hypothetical protein [Spongiibacteraceae bacterium]HCS27866.1 hypothetical protein [Spongiibacteraceae bacterium]|tara:strand:+ start:4254 stop:4436 length:183 start_codon:yes stop_codon:yes gene_type:complete